MRAVVKGTAYTLIHTPDMLKYYGSNQDAARVANPEDEFLKAIPKYLRPFDEVVSYPPNQVYIGNLKPEALRTMEQPWFKTPGSDKRVGPFGEIMTQEEFIVMMKHSDVFELVQLSKDFMAKMAPVISGHPILSKLDIPMGEGMDVSEMESLIADHTALGLYNEDVLVGCVKQAHGFDVNLNAHVMLENLATKASGVLCALHLADKNGIDMASVDYIIECSEEAVGDINQRGGGNMAKSIGEKSGCLNATGIDFRGFCAAPVHSIVSAAALVSAGVHKNVLVVAGGSIPKLGMNAKDHVKKELPILEDVLACFAVLVSEDDGVNPVINTDIVGKHNVGTGSSPQAVMTSLIYEPLNRNNLKITEVDKYSTEMQNPEITKPAGAGDVPEANYKMIAALAVMKKQLEKSELPAFVQKHGLIGYAATQGHIPSGVPFVGHAREDMLADKLNNCMIVGKGSLFLGRLTNLFDGMSVLIEKNNGAPQESSSDESTIRKIVAEAMKDLAGKLAASEEN